MSIVGVTWQTVRWPIVARGAARGMIGDRAALIIAVCDHSGATGLGEAAPLPGMSIDALADAECAAADFAARATAGIAVDTLADATALAEQITSAPAARFAIETSLLAVLAQRRRTSIAQLLQPAPLPTLRCAVVVDNADEARAAVARGAPCLKIKDGEPHRVEAIAAAAPGIPLRIDANRRWPRADVIARMTALRRFPIDYIEEPCLDAHELLDSALPCRIALDESLVSLDRAVLERALASPMLAALILKPTLLGGFARCLELASLAGRYGVTPIVSHTLEGVVGFAACVELAMGIAADVPVGLAPIAVADSDSVPVVAIIATPTADTIDKIRAAFDARRPIALLHPRLAPQELARQRDAVTTARLPDDAALILFTSGSTGSPRGIVHTRASLLAAADASAKHLGWKDDDKWLCCLPLAHAGGASIVIRCHVARRPVILLEGDFDPHHAAELLRDATLASFVPTQLAALLDDPRWIPPPQLRAVLIGGAAAPPALLAAAIARGVPIRTTYGLTETFGQVATACSSSTRPIPLPTVTLRAGTRVTPAPIRIAGPMLATCYLDGAPIAPELVTADLGFLEDGTLHVVGRADDVIISGGENVHPAEVEAVLAATTGVRAACAFGLADPRWGQIVAAAIATDETFDRTAALDAWHTALPPHARPRRLAMGAVLPVLPSGKIDRRAAAALPAVLIDYG